MIAEPKYRVGDHVRVTFVGQIEGVEAKVQKELVITGVRFGWKETQSVHLPPNYVYTASDTWPKQSDGGKKQYELSEKEIIPTEPLFNEVKRLQA